MFDTKRPTPPSLKFTLTHLLTPLGLPFHDQVIDPSYPPAQPYTHKATAPKATMPPPVMGISELLNHSSLPESSTEDDVGRLASTRAHELKLRFNRTPHRVEKLFRLKVHPSLLRNHRIMDIALRRKLAPKRTSTSDNCGLKLHLKSLEAGLRVRLISAPSIYDIFYNLTPVTLQSKHIFRLVPDPDQCTLRSQDCSADLRAARNKDHHINRIANGEFKERRTHVPLDLQSLLRTGPFRTKIVRLIDNNLVDLAGVPAKVLKALSHDKGPALGDSKVETFNLLDTAVLLLFNVHDYLLIRVTKLTSTNSEGSVLVKLETAMPGDPELIDDGEYIEDMVTSLGKPGQPPSNLFIKKVVARPRYKVDMKLYFVPTRQPMSLYVDPRVFERDLINGVINMEAVPERLICTTFPPDPILEGVRTLIAQSNGLTHEHSGPPVINHITENLHKFYETNDQVESEDSSLGFSSVPASRASIFSPPELELSSASLVGKRDSSGEESK